MLFLPLPLFVAFCLGFVLVHMVLRHRLDGLAAKLFAAVVALFALQSVLLALRWGYGWHGAAHAIVLLAPVLPVVSFMAFSALSGRRALWPLVTLALNWLALALLPDLADIMILLTYLGFGGLLLWSAIDNKASLSLVRLDETTQALRAMGLTGVVFIASGLTDLFVIYDFIFHQGAHIGTALSVAQSAFLLVIGSAALAGSAGAMPHEAASLPETADATREEDSSIMERLGKLFEEEALFQDTELSLRRLARRLGLPDRRLSQAINRSTQMSVSQHVNMRRIQHACQLLETTDASVLQVSLDAGFLSKSNFNREFSRIIGQTPSQWRASSRSKA